MANEFKVRKGLIVNGSGSTLLDVQGSQGQLFAITDSLSGSLFTVSDISGIPIFEVRSDDTIKLGTFNAEAIIVSGSHATVSGSFSGSFQGDGSGLTNINVDNIANVVDGSGGTNQIAYWSDTDTITGDANFFYNSTQDTLNINKVAVGNVTSEDFFRIKFTDFGGVANDVGIGLPVTGALGFNIRNGDYFQWNNGSAGEIMRLNSTGLGIGTTTPGASLHVASTTNDFVAKFSHTTATGYAPGSILLQAGQSVSRGQGIFHYNTEADDSWFTGVPYSVNSTKWVVAHKPDTTFNTDVAQLSHAILTIDSATDNIGIGESSPTSKLHIKGTGNEQIFITGSTARVQIKGASQSLHMYSWASGVNIYNGTSDSIYFGRDASTSNKFYFYDSSGVQTMLVNTATGRVGIGTVTTPGTRLHIVEAGGSSQLTLERTGGGAGKAVLAGAAEGFIVYDDVYGAKMYVGTAGTYNGRVGIGTITPDEKLHVVGDIKVTGELNNGANNSIDLDDHSGYTWFRNDNNSWAFQGGTSGDDWTQSFRLTLEAPDTSYNNKWLILGQQNSNQTEGKYKGVRIVKYNSGTIDGDLQAGTATFTGDLTVQGIVTAREFHTEFVSASIIYMSGSTKFGDTNDDNHNFTGSINVLSGSLNITGPSTDPGTPLTLHNSTNAAGVGIRFTDVAAGTTQYGRIVYRHSDSQSQGGGASFHFTGEPDLTLVLGDATNKGRFVASTANNAAEVDYGFYGDVNTGMYQPSNNSLGLVSNGSEKIRVNTNGAEIKNGNLYIPEYLYHVGDTDTYMRFLGDEIQFHAGGIKMLDVSEAGSTVIINQDSNDIDFRVEGNTDANLLFTDAGNDRVGIGTASPSHKLHVSGTADVVRIEGSGSTLFDIQGSQGQLFSVTDSLSGSLFAVGDISGIPILEVFSDTSVNIGTYGAEAIKVSGSNATVSGSFSGSFQGDGSGLTGISTSAPSNMVTTDTNQTITGVKTFSSDVLIAEYIKHDGDANTHIRFVGDRQEFTAGGVEFLRLNETTQNEIVFNEGSNDIDVRIESDTDTHAFFFQGNNGYLGLGGVTAPSTRLDVDGNIRVRNENELYFGGNTSVPLFAIGSSGNDLHFNDVGTNNSGDVIFANGGNVGIGITNPTKKLEVSGDAYISNTIELGDLADCTLSRFSAGNLAVEGKRVITSVDTGSFLRSDADDTATGLITFTNSSAFRTIELESTSPAVYFKDTDGTQGYHIGQNGDQFWILRDSDGNGVYNNILAHWNNNETKVYGNLIIGGDDNVFGVSNNVNEYWLNGSSTEGNTKILTHHDNAIELHAQDVIDFMSGSSDTSFRFKNSTSQMSIGFTAFNEALLVSGSISASGHLSVGNGGVGVIKAPGGTGKLILTTEKGGAIYIGESNASGSDIVHYSNVTGNNAIYSWTANSYDISPGTSHRLIFKSDTATQVYGTPFEVKNISYASNQSEYVLRIGATNSSSWDNWGIQAKSTATGAPYTSFRVPGADNVLNIVNSPAGYVGINTVAPSARLHINGGGSGAVAFKVTPGNAGKEWSIDASNPDHLKKEENIVLSADPGNVHSNTTIGFRIDGSTKAQLTSQGRLGINKTSPETELDVEGTIFGAIRRRPQMETAAGGTGVNDGADTWAKIVTFDLSASSYNDLYVKYIILDSEAGASGGYAELLIRLRKNNATTMDICDLQILRMSHITEGNITSFTQMLHEDSFKLVNNGHADVQLWVQKKKSYGKFIVYEDAISFDGWRTSQTSYNATITYNNNAAWQSSTPSGTNNFLQYLASTRAVHQYAFFTNYSGQHRYIPINSTFPSANANYTHKYILPKSGRLLGVKLMANNSITNLKLKTYRMDGGTPVAHGSEKSLNLIANTPAWIKLDLNFYQSNTYTAAGFSIQPPSTTGYYFNMAAVWQF